MLKQPLNKTFLFVTDKALPNKMIASFQSITQLKQVLKVQVYPNVTREYSVYYLQNFKGYL